MVLKAQPEPTPSSNNNNNANQPNPNNQTGISPAPQNLLNNSLGSMSAQLTFGSTSGGGLLGNPQPSGGLFGNQTQQQPPSGGLFGGQAQQAQGGGSLFSNQVQQQRQTGGLFGGPQPSGGLFGNQIQQQPSSGGLFGGQVRQQPQPGGLFGNRTSSSLHSRIPRMLDSSSNGSVWLIGSHDVNNYPRNKQNISLVSITNRHEFRGATLDEIRMKDYFDLKNNTLDPAQKRVVSFFISTNLRRLGGIGTSNIHSHFASTGLPPNLATLYSDPNIRPQPVGNSTQPAPTSGGLIMNSQPSQITQNTQPTTIFGGDTTQAVPASGGLFMNPPPSQIILSSMDTNNTLQSSSLPTPVIQPETKPSVIKSVKPTATKSEKKSLELNSGSFSYEFNKMLFVSGLIQIMEKHNMKVPENLLDNTDFAPQLLAFLEQHHISLPTENVPQFQINSACLPADECE